MKHTAGKQESQTLSVLPKGIYHWKVLPSHEFGVKNTFTANTEDAISKSSGNEMVQLIVKIGDKNGSVVIFDYLVGGEKSEWKVNQFLYSAGVHPGEGVNVDLTARNAIGLHGKCDVDVEQNASGYDKNIIKKYLEAPVQDTKYFITVPSPTEEELDEVPF